MKPLNLSRCLLVPALVGAAIASSAAFAFAQNSTQAAVQAPTEEGIPVTSRLVIQKCGGCHVADSKGNLSRISWERTTPEGWELAIKRMIRLNGVRLSPEEAREIVKYLASHHGLAPEEAKLALYEAERRLQDEKVPNNGVRDSCTACHTLGRIMSWRRSKEEWNLLVKMHIGYFPQTETVTFRKRPPAIGDPEPPPGTDPRDPVDIAIEYISKTFPLHTSEWAAWSAETRSPLLAGKWIVTGSQVGKGRVMGELTIQPGQSPDEFTTTGKLTYLKDGKTMAVSGRSLVYAGYAWRGSGQNAEPGKAIDDPKVIRQVMQVSRDQSEIGGRWFWGAYDEFGIDVTMRRLGGDPVVTGLDRLSLKSGSTAQQVTILGANLPSGVAVSDISLGSGVTVKRVVNQSADRITAEVDVANDAVLGKRDVIVRGSLAPAAFAVYDKIDYIKVTPDWAMSRLGGAPHPKGYQQFEAVAYNRGPDNLPNTADDVNLGPIEVQWSVEEFVSTFGDDDKAFVGHLDATGLFTPAIEGPNPERKFSKENHGNVWVVATYTPDTAGAKPMVAKSYMIVTIPLYVRWDQPEVSQ
jgi:quinohemoprotein amine dehydrogenase